MEHFNEEYVRQTYRFLAHEKSTGIRLINPQTGKVRSLFVSNEDDFVLACKQSNGFANIYVGINERSESGTKLEHVVAVRAVVIDIDAIREAGFEKDAATTIELKRAEHVRLPEIPTLNQPRPGPKRHEFT